MDLSSSGIYCSCGPKSENERKREYKQILDSSQRTGKDIEHEVDSDTNCMKNSPKGVKKETREIGN